MANTFKVGEIEISVVSDGEATVKGAEYFPASSPATVAAGHASSASKADG